MKFSSSLIIKSFYSRQWPKIFATLSLVFLAIGICIAHANPVKGYELNIYEGTPFIVWLSVYSGFLVGGGIILSQVIKKEFVNNKTWIIGLVILLLSRMVFLYIPYLRGYISWRGDNIAYLGMAEDILLTGHFTTINIYPITHIVLSGVSQITGISIPLIANVSTAVVSVLFVLFVYLLVGAVTNSARTQVIATVMTGIVILAGGYNVILSPNGWSIFFVPMLFYLYFKRFNRTYRLLLILILIAYPFFHPLSALIVILALAILELAGWALRYFPKTKQRDFTTHSNPSVIAFIAIELMIFFIWVLAHQQLNMNLNILWNQITTGTSTGKLSELGQSLGKINIQGLNFIVLLFKNYGAVIILTILSAFGIPWLIKPIRNSRMDTKAIISLLCVFIFCGLFYIGYLLGIPGTGALAGGQWDRRLLGYVEVLLPLFATLGCISIFIFTTKRKIRAYQKYIISLVICLLFLCSLQTFASVYPSPFVYEGNSQITLMELTGAKWFVEKKDQDIGSTYILSNLDNVAAGIIGYQESIRRSDLHAYGNLLPDHFGYTTSSSLGTSFTADKYAVITKLDRTVYSTVWETVGRFNNTDFNQLENDIAVNKLYSNNEMDIYYIVPN